MRLISLQRRNEELTFLLVNIFFAAVVSNEVIGVGKGFVALLPLLSLLFFLLFCFFIGPF